MKYVSDALCELLCSAHGKSQVTLQVALPPGLTVQKYPR